MAVDDSATTEEDTPVELITKLRPDVHIKGGDYKEEDLPEGETVRAYGGNIIIVPFVDGYSTTGIMDRMNSK